MKRANYEIVEENEDRIVIRDIGPWDRFLTITNAAETVVAELAPMLNGKRLEYIDSIGDRDELLVEGGRFTGFKLLPR